MRGLPVIDMRYWLLLVVASLCGTNLGDFASGSLNLGFLGAFPAFAIVFVAIVLAAPRAAFMPESFYWLAIVVSRAGATDLADFATHQLRLPFPALLAAALFALGAVIRIGAWLGQSTLAVTMSPQGSSTARPDPSATYWTAMLFVSAFGTMAGDYLADGLGLHRATLLTIAVTASAALWLGRIIDGSKLSYWVVVAAVRTAATNMGDFAAGEEGLHWGPALSFAVSFAALMVFTLATRSAAQTQAA